jgi:hypothetical protein
VTDVDRQIERAADALERARTRTAPRNSRTRRKREAEVARRVGRIAIADAAIIVGALVLGAFVPLGIGGAFLVMALLIAATMFFAVYPVEKVPPPERLAETPIRALPSQTERWLESQRPALPAPAQTLVDSIGVKLETLAPQLATLDDREPAAGEVRKLVAEQLPELVKGYDRVPQPLRRVERNGATPEQQLVDGLKVIDEEISKMTEQLAQGDLDLLATRGRYLQIRYQGDSEV